MPTTTQNKERLDQIAPLILKRLGKIYNIRDAGLEYHFKFVDLENPDAVSPTIRLLVKMVVAPGDEEKERKRIQEDELVRRLYYPDDGGRTGANFTLNVDFVHEQSSSSSSQGSGSSGKD